MYAEDPGFVPRMFLFVCSNMVDRFIREGLVVMLSTGMITFLSAAERCF